MKIFSKWSGYKKTIGVGDLNGDGYGDLLAQDTSNKLWRYAGMATGGFRARVNVADNWGATCNVVVGAADITGDGRADIVSRDTSGKLWRNNGDGKGSFGPRNRDRRRLAGLQGPVLTGRDRSRPSSGPHREVGLHDRVRRIVKADFVLGDRMRRSAWRAAPSRAWAT
ncbi:FG-GAP repeat domain-containing protein [Streptomyces mirabilis]|uniref:FG-GAP repeat domain-containing protein n=1 Tax=Streptomyces mirabilis TaxID=68239 RepID=UPI0036578878